MGNKIITEKDFWMCSCGAVPAQFQSTQKTVKKKSGEKFITTRDTATSSWIDFGCTRMMLIMAIIAAAVVVIAAMTVATGGAALIALGAIAGLAGAAWGAVLGTLLCGQLAAKARKWVGSKNNYIVQGVETVTGDHTMTCPVGGKITYAPQIKNWSQAIALGAGNYIGHLMEGMMAGAAIGMGGALISGGAGAFASGGIRGVGQAAFQFAKSAPMNVIRNIGATFGYAGAGASTSTVVTTAATAVGLRGVTATQAGLQHYGSTGESGWGAAGRGVFAMEEGMYHSGGNILSGNAGWQDVTGLALLLSPVHRAPDELNGRNGKPVKDGEAARDGETAQDGEQKKAEDENVRDASTTPEETAKKDGEGEAYEATKPEFEKVTLPDGTTVKRLKPNSEYEANGYKYKTDGQGRIINAKGKLSKAVKGGRNPYAQRTVGKGDGRLAGDHGGHLIGDQFGGSGGKENMVPMDGQVNNYHKGKWGQMEKKWSNAIDEGKSVEVNIEPQYTDASSRPSSFKVVENIDGNVKTYKIINK
ncbi:DNA/RNA non-specific endonuclease [Pedobacter rhodius]|uniref:DNA/RNA non-specific endonuclease n=1 Tax=Pedobacter rhodius TaxID=3004098 RepID=A0ABT4KYH1_9SPHI|nr:DNA/RNA non-specific endonuclease [Pedobacter sp. SJ11]MCZ4223983.1 DNA/RNA non-specific endonuclease [Pedobacter sp. SJ11]